MGKKMKLETIAMSEDTYMNSLYFPCYDHQGCSGIQVLLNTFHHWGGRHHVGNALMCN